MGAGSVASRHTPRRERRKKERKKDVFNLEHWVGADVWRNMTLKALAAYHLHQFLPQMRRMGINHERRHAGTISGQRSQACIDFHEAHDGQKKHGPLKKWVPMLSLKSSRACTRSCQEEHQMYFGRRTVKPKRSLFRTFYSASSAFGYPGDCS